MPTPIARLRPALLLAASLLSVAPAAAQHDAPPKPEAPAQTPPAEPVAEPEPVVTEHTLDLPDGPLHYRATAGRLTMKNEEGKPRAHVFFIAYERLVGAEGGRAPDGDRPITFVFNGGPGAAAVWLHLGAAGPRVVELDDAGRVLPPPARLVDNAHTWLDQTDLVFIDPVGTGFSRAAAGEDPKQFFGVQNDIAAVAEFIRLYLTKHGRWPSPKFLAGESYGTTRAAGLSEHLLEEHGIAINGIVLISTVLDFATIREADNNLLPHVLFLPSYAAVAHYHGRLPDDLQRRDVDELRAEVAVWAESAYLPALAAGEALPEATRDGVATTLARYTGLPEDLIRRSNLRIDPGQFEKALLADERRIVGRFDGRIVGFAPQPVVPWPEYDPSLSLYLPAYTSTFNHYVREALGYRSELKYEVLTGNVRPWDFGGGGEQAGFLNMAARLRNAMVQQPAMRVLVAAGIYDLATPAAAADYTVRHLDLSPELRANITQSYYTGGHMMFHERASRGKLDEDIARFIERALN